MGDSLVMMGLGGQQVQEGSLYSSRLMRAR